MTEPPSQNLAPFLAGVDESAAARLMDVVYSELRTRAGRFLDGKPGVHTLQPTALVHEAYLKVASRDGERFDDKAHFLAFCAVAMRSILADHARRRRSSKRGGDWNRVTLTGLDTPVTGNKIDAIVLDEALTELSERFPRQARVIEYRFFSGMTVDEVARALEVSRTTAEEDWRMAKAWLKARLNKDESS